MKNLLTILFSPRETMKGILANRDRMVVPLVLLAIASSGIKDVRLSGARQAVKTLPSPTVWLIVTAVFLCVIPLLVAFFYLLAWIAVWVGRLFEGRATTRAVRSALAWGGAPVIWALLYRIPVALLVHGSETTEGKIRAGHFVFNPQQLSSGCGFALAIAMLNFVVLVWYLIVTSNTLAEAFDFSGWRGFATLLLTWLSPVVVLLAAALAKVF